MAVDVLSSTTLSEAITDATGEFTVASTANITAGVSLLVVRGEAMKVTTIPVSGRVTVNRGVNGTLAKPHASGTRAWIGAHDAFKAVKESQTALVGDPGTLPDYLLPGQRAFDHQGNEYVLVELTEPVYTGVTVVFSRDQNFQAAVLATGTQGQVGVMAEPATSDQYAWAQIGGYVAAGQEAGGTSAATSAYLAIPATSVSSPAAGMAAVVTSGATLGLTINGMFIVGVAVSTTTSATSVTGVTVPLFLVHPWVNATVAGSS